MPPLRVMLYSPYVDVRTTVDQLLSLNELGQVLIYPTFVDLYAAAFDGQGELAIVDSLGTPAGLDSSEREALVALRQLVPTIYMTARDWAAPNDLQVSALLRKPFELDELVAAIEHAAGESEPTDADDLSPPSATLR
ncbi:MAG TPA: hypothetical protein VGQ62_19500 [Chloroflexota bacterium]|nr:hypothetical protein [Chloroflexota bacterium]